MATQQTIVNEIGNEVEVAGAETALAPAQQHKATALKSLLTSKMPAIAAVATRHLSAEKLVKIMGTAASRTPLLLECTPPSVLQAVMTLAELGLAPGPLGSAYLIPFRNGKTGQYECQLIVGYRGLITLARRSGEVATVQAEVVRAGDEFEFEYGLDQKFRHKPALDNKGEATHVWAMATFKDGSKQFIVMTRGEVAAIRAKSRAGNAGPWVDYPDEMAKKTAIRRLAKMLPLTPEVEQMIAVADRTEFSFEQLTDGAEVGERPALPAGPSGVAAAAKRLRAEQARRAAAGTMPAPGMEDPEHDGDPMTAPPPPAKLQATSRKAAAAQKPESDEFPPPGRGTTAAAIAKVQVPPSRQSEEDWLRSQGLTN